MRRSALFAVLAGAAIVLAGAIAWWRPFLFEKRNFVASIPQPAPLFTLPLVRLETGERTCFAPAVIDTPSRRAGFVLGDRPGQPMRLTITGSGYRFATRVAGHQAPNTGVEVPVPAPARDTAVRVCIENVGGRSVSLWGANDRTRTPLTVTGAAAKTNANVVFSFYEARPGSLAGHVGIALKRMAEFRPGVVVPWLLWPLALFCVVGIPVGALWALWHSVRADADEDEWPEESQPHIADPHPEPEWDPASAT